MDITLLHEDIRYYMNHWSENTSATKAQKETWTQKKKIPIYLLGNDDDKSLRLLKEDGWDGICVGSVTSNTARHYSYDNEDHIWMRNRDIIRFGVFFHLGFHKTIALLVKRNWEKYFSNKIDWKNNVEGRTLIDLLKNSQDEAIKLSMDFNNHIKETGLNEKMYKAFEDVGVFPNESGYDIECFKMLVSELIMKNLHLIDNNSKELCMFISTQQSQFVKMHVLSKNNMDEFKKIKKSWIELEMELMSLRMEHENCKLRLADIKFKWMYEFGKKFIEYEELKSKYKILKKKIDLKKAMSDIDRNELEELLRKELKDEEERILEFKFHYQKSMMYKNLFDENESHIGTYDFDIESKRIFRKITLMTHPDKTRNEDFTKVQKEKLKNLYNKALESKKDCIALKEIYDSVKLIWANMGQDINENQIINGDTIKKQLEWLTSRIEELKNEKNDIRNKIMCLYNEYMEQYNDLDTQNSIQKRKERIVEEIVFYKIEIENLKKQFEEAFNMH